MELIGWSWCLSVKLSVFNKVAIFSLSFFFSFAFISLLVMDQLFIRLSESLGGRVAPDHLKLAFSILSTYPSAFVFKRLGSSTLKHLFSIVYTSWIMLFVLQLTTGFIHIMSAATITYVLGRYCHTKQLAWINFAMAMLSMSIW